MKKLIVLFFFLNIFTGNLVASQRGIWVVRDALTSKESISKIISNSKDLKIDTIFLQFRALGNVYYPTLNNIPQKHVDDELLALLFKTAVQNNIKVHVWLNVCYIWHKKILPSDPNHIIYRTQNAKVEPTTPGIESEGYYLHPNDNSNLSEIITVIKELYSLYNIDGVHLDYFRYPKEINHVSKIARTEYMVKHGLDPLIPLSNPKNFVTERGAEAFYYFQNTYKQFLRNELTEALRKIKSGIEEINPGLKLSVAVKPNPVEAKHRFMQDWLFWVENELCDFVVMMNYNPKMPKFKANIKITKEKIGLDRIRIGIATYNIKNEEVLKRIKYVDNDISAGYVLFSYNSIKKNNRLYNVLKHFD
ncbi:MAG: family 10 glycosylhydrolase [Calditrichaeota bacterium]|nr:family 10 glycosylhydrolase [Calditrichota bacterium]